MYSSAGRERFRCCKVVSQPKSSRSGGSARNVHGRRIHRVMALYDVFEKEINLERLSSPPLEKKCNTTRTAEMGDLATLRRARTRMVGRVDVRRAAWMGHLACLKYARKRLPVGRVDVRARGVEGPARVLDLRAHGCRGTGACVYAAQGGYVDCLAYARKQVPVERMGPGGRGGSGARTTWCTRGARVPVERVGVRARGDARARRLPCVRARARVSVGRVDVRAGRAPQSRRVPRVRPRARMPVPGGGAAALGAARAAAQVAGLRADARRGHVLAGSRDGDGVRARRRGARARPGGVRGRLCRVRREIT